MRPLLTLTLAAALLLPRAAPAADFEGVLTFKMTGKTSGTMRALVSKAGMRVEADMQAPPELQRAGMGKTVRMVTIMRLAEPNTVYLLHPEQKTYFVAENDSDDARSEEDEETYTVKRTGKDRVAGLSCEKATLTSEDGERTDLCITNELRGESTWMRAFSDREEDGIYRALRKAGLVGFPVRWSSEGMTMELTAHEKRSLPASTFAIPAGYKKTENPFGLPEAEMSRLMQESMKEGMKDLSPEQRKQLEEMMKRQGGK
jgi:hypothetical protein